MGAGGSNLGIALSPRGRHVWIARVYVLQPDRTHAKRVGRLFRRASVLDKSLDEARVEKRIWDGEAAQGIDPIEKRRPTRPGVGGLEGLSEPSRPATISMLLDRYMAEHVGRELEQSTQQRYRELARHLDRHLGSVACHELGKKELMELRREFADRRETFNKLRKMLAHAYKTAAALDWKHQGTLLVPGQGFNPALLVPLLDTAATRKGGDPFEPEEIEALLRAAQQALTGKSSRASRSTIAFPLFLLFTGLRKNEGRGLTWIYQEMPKESGWRGWIDRRRGVIQLIHHKTSRKKGSRVVPLSPQAIKVLEIVDGADDLWVFIGRQAGQPLACPEKTWREFQQRAGIRSRGLHQTRHTFITRALEAGAPIGAVGKAVGHSTAYMTEVYGHISDRAARSAAEMAGNGIDPMSLGW